MPISKVPSSGINGGAIAASESAVSNTLVLGTSGRVGINEPNPSQAALVVTPITQGATGICVKSLAADSNGLNLSMDVNGVGYINAGYNVSSLVLQTNSIERFRITSNGQLTSTNSDGNSINTVKASRYGYSGSYQALVLGATSGNTTVCINVDPSANSSGNFSGTGNEVMFKNDTMFIQPNSTNTSFLNVLRLNNGNVNVLGALSKGSGSFRIDHPLPSLTETHELVHSFIEGPQADLIYRGKVNLVAGAATINIDTASDMTEGTFVALCRDVQCFTTNESDWTPVRGSVSGNILTIEAQDNTSTASISWMVIGERKDKHMYDTEWTDENGKVIVEPLKAAKEPTAEEQPK